MRNRGGDACCIKIDNLSKTARHQKKSNQNNQVINIQNKQKPVAVLPLGPLNLKTNGYTKSERRLIWIIKPVLWDCKLNFVYHAINHSFNQNLMN